MNEKNHVGRPTNEEVSSRKKKKVVKYSLIAIVSILLVGGIFLFFNRDNIDFSSLMGASSLKTYNYAVDSSGSYYMNLKTSSISKIKSCYTSKTSYLSCELSSDGKGVILKAKKSGTVTVHVYATNNKGKTVSMSRRIKIGKDFTSPTCRISTPSTVVRRGSNSEVTATITCSENVSLTSDASKLKNGYISLNYKSVIEGGCSPYKWFTDYITSIKRVNNKGYSVSLKIPRNACITKELSIYVAPGTFKDNYNNQNYNGFRTSIRIVK